MRSQKSPWITADSKKLMHGRDIMKIKAINSNDPHDWAFTPQNVISTQNVIRVAAKCNTNARCNNIDAKCNKIFNAECNNLSTQIVITFLTHNVITQNVIISE